jgi:hypothetical protein
VSEIENTPQVSTPNVDLQGATEPAPIVGDPTRYSRFITAIVILFLLLIIIAGVLAFTSPSSFWALVNGFWILIFGIVLAFLVLGVLIMVGLKNQVKQILDIFVEGTLTIVDVINFIKLAINFVGEVIKQAIYLLIPVISYLLGAAIYYGLMFSYKWVAKSYDVLGFTIFLAALLVILTGFLNARSKDEGSTELTWGRKIQLRFKDFFGDALEVVLFIFFFTIDSTNLFFLPKDLNVEVHAQFQDYNFMVRGWTVDAQLKNTLNLVMAAVGLEIVRFIMRIVAAGFAFYKEVNEYVGESNDQMSGADQVKWSLRQSFQVHSDDVLRFITYTTFIVAVFLAFPRLKLLAMAVASLTALILDLAMHDRLVIKRGKDLFSKLITLLFKV